MKIKPALAELEKIISTGEFKIVPVSYELPADICTPIEVLRIIKNISPHCYLLESVAEREHWGRYTFLGFDPKLCITCMEGKITVGDKEFFTDNPSEEIRKILSAYKSPRLNDLPTFTGGLVGYFAYDYLSYSEPSIKLKLEDEENFQDADLMLFDKVIAFDNFKQKIILIVNIATENLEQNYNQAAAELNLMKNLILRGTKKIEPPAKLLSEIKPLFERETYCEMVNQAKNYIHEGDIFQIVLSNRLSAEFEGSLLDAYRVLRMTNPSPYM
ncbi:MAG: chorismate-binding protein, partial [Selenomonadaceae bacterium]|nr:chorismate-binding protein [Selenomonadaceae bacterium]